MLTLPPRFTLFFFKDPATTDFCTLSLRDALPISGRRGEVFQPPANLRVGRRVLVRARPAVDRRGDDLRLRLDVGRDRKSTRLNSSHANISYAVFCLIK